MKTVTLEILNDKAFQLLLDLEQLKVIRLKKEKKVKKIDKTSIKEASFSAIGIDTKHFTFDREEANER